MSDALTVYQEYRAIANLADREEVVNLSARFAEVAASKNVVETLKLVSAQEGVPFGTLRRKFYAWRTGGDAALADRRKVARVNAESVFYGDFKEYAARDLNTSRGGYDAMLRDLRRGKSFAFGTWRDCWKRDYPLEAVPSFCPANYVPKGFTYANMMRLQSADASRAMALAWSRQGQFAAIKYTLPVVRSRVGLHVGEVVQSDDVWHNFDVFATGLKGVFNPLEFAFYDVASAFKCMSVMKPRSLVIDPKTGKESRDNLKEMQYRFAVAYMMCCRGFYKGGITLIGERGTTALRDNVLRRIAAVPGYGRLFHFQTSGVKNTPAHKGLFIGNAGGNPRMKSLCECAHNVLHNATASILGNHGRDAAHLHESNAALVKYSTDMIEQARAIDPAIIPLLQLPILEYGVYAQYFYAIEDAVMDRTEHNLEGWQNNVVTEYRLSLDSPWRPIDELKDMAPEEVQAIAAVLARDKDGLMRQRKMSRREVWKSGQKDLEKWPLLDMPAFLDPRDAREGKVRADGTIQFTDAVYYAGQNRQYVAQFTNRRTGVVERLAPGTAVKFFWNPLGELADQIWITADDGETVLGMCPMLKVARWSDPQSIKVAMGQQQSQIAQLMAETHAAGEMQGVAKSASLAINKAILEAAKVAKQKPLAVKGEGATLDELANAGAAERREVETDEDVDVGEDDAMDFLSTMNEVSAEAAKVNA